MATNPLILDCLWKKTGTISVDLEFSGTALDEYPSFRAFAVISNILRTELGRIRSIRASCEIPVPKTIFFEMTGRADALEYLQVTGLSLAPGTRRTISLGGCTQPSVLRNNRHNPPMVVPIVQISLTRPYQIVRSQTWAY
jgi:hypothetical protein